MTRLVTAALCILLMTSAAFTQNNSADEKQIAENEHALGQAMIQKDLATLSRLVADDWSMLGESGAGTKSGFLNDIKSGTLVVKSFQIHDMHIRVLGDVAIVQAYDDEQTTYAGKDSSGTYNWTDVWQKRNGQWVSIATQLTTVKKNQ